MTCNWTLYNLMYNGQSSVKHRLTFDHLSVHLYIHLFMHPSFSGLYQLYQGSNQPSLI